MNHKRDIRNNLRIIGFYLLILAVIFVIYALSNPQFSFPWSNAITYTVYAAYAIITAVCFIMSVRKK